MVEKGGKAPDQEKPVFTAQGVQRLQVKAIFGRRLGDGVVLQRGLIGKLPATQLELHHDACRPALCRLTHGLLHVLLQLCGGERQQQPFWEGALRLDGVGLLRGRRLGVGLLKGGGLLRRKGGRFVCPCGGGLVLPLQRTGEPGHGTAKLRIGLPAVEQEQRGKEQQQAENPKRPGVFSAGIPAGDAVSGHGSPLSHCKGKILPDALYIITGFGKSRNRKKCFKGGGGLAGGAGRLQVVELQGNVGQRGAFCPDLSSTAVSCPLQGRWIFRYSRKERPPPAARWRGRPHIV